MTRLPPSPEGVFELLVEEVVVEEVVDEGRVVRGLAGDVMGLTAVVVTV